MNEKNSNSENTRSLPLPELHLDIARNRELVKISAFEQYAGKTSTVRHYDEIPVSRQRLGDCCHETVKMLNKANRRGTVPRDILDKLRETGQVLSDDLFTPYVKELIKKTSAEHLLIHMDDQMVHIPWELLHIENEFLCQKFSMGRMVRTRQQCYGDSNLNPLEAPLRMLILADPAGDLKGAYSEGIMLRDHMDCKKDALQAALCADNITSDYIRKKIRQFDMVHFAGHCDYDAAHPERSGWRLTNGHIRANEIMKMAGTGSMPAFIFTNACQSARTGEWNVRKDIQNEIFGLANAFVISGVRHYVGTFWEIPDEPGKRFALEFYRFLLAGKSVGQSMSLARQVLIREYGEETIIWASYLLYGDPAFCYLDQTTKQDTKPFISPAQEKSSGIRGRVKEDIIDFGQNPGRSRVKNIRFKKMGILTAIAIIIISGFIYLTDRFTDRSENEHSVINSSSLVNQNNSINSNHINSLDKQERIDRLIEELQKKMKPGKINFPSDNWTSRTMTLWIMDFETPGKTIQNDFIGIFNTAMSQALLEYKNIRLVERRLLNELLTELKLSSSELAAPATALRLGRILAARLILFGKIIYAKPYTHVSMRLIETETGNITAVISETFEKKARPLDMAKKMSEKLWARIKIQYPLRGKISYPSNGQKIIINIGQNHGVSKGQIFKAVDKDLSFKVLSVQEHESILIKIEGSGRPVDGLEIIDGQKIEEFINE